MDRTIVYPGAIPLDTDLLSTNRNTMIAIGALARMVLGSATVIDGLACTPTSPASLTVTVGSGSIATLSVVDALAYGSLPADAADPLVKIGTNIAPTNFTLAAPTSAGQAINWLIEASFQEADINPVVMPYYNAANPQAPFSGPNNSGTAQNTLRTQRVQLQAKQGVPATVGTQMTPATDAGWIGLFTVTVQFGQTAITAANIAALPNAPFIANKLPNLLPGFGSGVATITTPGGMFTVPPGVTQVDVEVWGGGSGSFASVPNFPSGGGSGGGYARKRITGLVPGQQIPVSVAGGGGAGTTAGILPSAGGSSSFGTFVSASGGALNALASLSAPQNGATPGGVGSGGDVNLQGSSGSHGLQGQTAAGGSGMGGAAPFGGAVNGGTVATPGAFPGGGASGAGTGSNGTAAFNGAAGAPGLVVIRW